MKFFKIIPTRILAELFLIFILMQVGFTFIFVIIGIFLQDVLSRMPIMQIPALIPYIFPFAQSFCGQLVMVFTCAMIYSRIAQSNELLALQSSGISSWRVLSPSLLLAFLMSILSFWMTDLKCSWGKEGIQKTFLSSLETIIYKTLETDKCIQIADDYFLSVNRVEGKKLYELFLTSKDSNETRLFSAEQAELTIGPAVQIIQPKEVCYTKNGEIYHVDPNNSEVIVKIAVFKPDFQLEQSQMTSNLERTVVLSLDELSAINSRKSQRVSNMSLVELNDFVDVQLTNIRNTHQEIALQSALTLQTGKLYNFGEEAWFTDFYNTILRCEKNIRRAKIEPTRRLAFAFNCFFLTLVCAPLSLKKGNMGTLMLISCVVLPILFIFFPAAMLMLQIVKDSEMTPLLLWIPNLVMFIVGIRLVHQAL